RRGWTGRAGGRTTQTRAGESSLEEFVLRDGLRRLRGPEDVAQPLLPLLHVEVVLVLKRPPEDRRKFVERGEQLRDGFPQRLDLEATLGRAHVFEDALLGARGDDRLR